MKSFFLSLAVMFCLSANAQIYLRNYEVSSSDKVVGGITATRTPEGDYVRYDVSSEVSMRILFEVNVSYKVQAIYKSGILVSSSATIYLNGNVQNNVNCERTGDHYTVVADGHTTRIYEDIKWSSALLYFNKPKDTRKIFSETEGAFKDLSETADGKFKLKDSEKESNVNTYTFSSDQGLQTIIIERSLLPTLKVTGVRQVKLDKDKPEEEVESEK
ncbi:hypothetical protein G3O08_17930 [Cryomorpha ignava]|uniref:DUF4292 domain-containing protein n=1 Tax=Cryomorpha ignava TaxID=101383 RepID=A0A7K3WUM6_9FLAO|nr:DUF6134 family protein [Cryomorpha ignava]NEN25379.1 hypothetical protein [Cryomorpha ignava]